MRKRDDLNCSPTLNTILINRHKIPIEEEMGLN